MAKRIEDRVSYKRMESLAALVNKVRDGQESPHEILLWVHDQIDSMHGYGTEAKSMWAQESTDAVISKFWKV